MKILGISGKRSAGKNCVANYITTLVIKGIQTQQSDNPPEPLVDWIRINNDGKIVVPAQTDDGIEEGILDLDNSNPEFQEWAHRNFWQFVRTYAIATPIKEFCHDYLNIPWNHLYGTPEEKESPTQYKWGAVVHKLPKGKSPSDIMTARDVVKYIGEWLRRLDENIHVNKVLRQAETYGSLLTIVTDVRRPNEVNAIKSKGGKVIRLLRNPVNDKHDSETGLDTPNYDINNFDAVVANEEMSILETCQTVEGILNEWGYLEL